MRLLLLILFLNIVTSAQWMKVNNGLPDSWQSNSSISAASSHTAAVALYIYPESHIYLTTNAGDEWTEISVPDEITNIHINDIQIIDGAGIWICTGESDPLRGRIFFTSDNGVTWVKQYENKDVTTFFNYIEMFDELNGVAMGDAPFGDVNKPAVFLRTVNGGITWNSMNNDFFLGGFSAARWQTVDFVNLYTGFFLPSYTQGTAHNIYKTQNGGISWEISQGTGFGEPTVVKFLNTQNGIVFRNGTSEKFFYTTSDGGSNWSYIATTEITQPIDIEYVDDDPNKLWLIESSRLMYSSNGGTSWHNLTPAESFAGVDVEFAEQDYGWLLTTNSVYYTTEGGNPTVGVVKSDEIPSSFGLEQNYPNPFNPSTKISFSIPEETNVTLAVYDLIGTEIATLVKSDLSSGSYEYDFNAAEYNLSSGIYFYRLLTKDYSIVKKMTYLK